MRVAIMSDSHDHIWNMRKAIKLVQEQGVDCIIHCGDLISPFMLKEFSPFSGPVHLVSGNNDGEQHLLTEYCLKEFQHIIHHGVTGKLQAGRYRIAFTHYYPMARGLAALENYDLVCYGHSHVYKSEKIGKTIYLNPGEIMGKEGPPTFCIFDTASEEMVKLSF